LIGPPASTPQHLPANSGGPPSNRHSCFRLSTSATPGGCSLGGPAACPDCLSTAAAAAAYEQGASPRLAAAAAYEQGASPRHAAAAVSLSGSPRSGGSFSPHRANSPRGEEALSSGGGGVRSPASGQSHPIMVGTSSAGSRVFFGAPSCESACCSENPR
jgi:hypothetical protein